MEREMITKGLDQLAGIVPASDAGIIKDGILYCPECQEAKQCKVTMFGVTKTFPCLCKCEVAEQEAAEARVKDQTKQARMRQLKDAGTMDGSFRDTTFECDDGNDKSFIDFLKKYADNKNEILAKNIGLYIYGDYGCGKTFGAACLANRLLDMGESVLMSTFSRLERMIFDSEDKNMTISEIMGYNFLILDDFGAERKTEYQLEMLYTIIDERYKSGKPIILTSNIPFDALMKPQHAQEGRIYERVVQMCQPLKKAGKSRRISEAVNKAKLLSAIMNGDEKI